MDHSTADASVDRLTALRQLSILDTPPEAGFDRLTRIATNCLDVPVALVSLVDEHRQFFKSHSGLPQPLASVRETPLSHSFCQHVVASGEPLVISDAREHPLVKGNPSVAEYGVVAYAGVPLVLPAGHVIGSLCAIDVKPRDWSATDVEILRDLAASVMSELSLKRAKESAEAANRAKDRFLAMLSHELRTPLSPALLLCAALAADESLPAAVRADARTVERNVQQQTRLVDDLLDVTRIENGKLSLQRARLDLCDLLEDVVAHCRPEGAAKGVAVSMQPGGPRPHVHADGVRLRQVFTNLVRNAVKFTPGGGTVTVAQTPGGPSAVDVSVTDTGIGIDPVMLSQIFDPFEQGSRAITDEFSGLGLGLAISKGLVDAHGGRITAASDGPGHGTRMTVTLSTVAAPAAPVIARPPVVPAGRATFHILLVEDHRDTMAAMSRLLRRFGHRVTGAESMTAALTAAAAASTDGQAFDLLISDVDLPDGSGLDLMRQLAQTHPVRGIALTGYGMESDMADSRAAGFSAHLVKPINFKDLEEAIQRSA